MLVVKTKLSEIPGKGIGLIADQGIKKGQPVWVYNPIIDITVMKHDIPLEAKELFDTYAVDVGEPFVFLNIDNARFINHSDTPNTAPTGPGPYTDNVAIKDIYIGEEITIDYNAIDVHGDDF